MEMYITHTTRDAMKKNIASLTADEYPISVIARRIGISRQDVYCFLNPGRYHYRLTDEKLQKIADFEGRSFRSVRAEYEQRKAA